MDQKNFKFSQLKHISDVSYLEESNNMRLVLKGVATITLLLVLFVIWSAFVKITETTKSFGQLIPEGSIPLVQHLEGGTIEKIYVKDGMDVKKGQKLLQLHTEELESELQQLRSQEVSLILEAERLEAFLANKPPQIDLWSTKVLVSKHNLSEQNPEIDSLLQEQARLLESQYDQINDQKAALTNLLEQRKIELVEYMDKKKIWMKHMELLEEEFEMYKKLKSTNYISSKDYITIIRSLNQAKGEGADIDSKAEQTRQAIGEAENKLKQVNSESRQKAFEELAKAKALLLEIYYRIEKGVAQIARSNVVSPIDGRVKGLSLLPGAVIKPGQELMEVVPFSDKLVGETKILPREIGYLKIGNPVKIKILTYDYARFGSLDGKLVDISASTFVDSEGTPYYKARVSLAEQGIMINGKKKALKAGMTIECDIITGSKTLLEYLLKPIHRAVTESFHER